MAALKGYSLTQIRLHWVVAVLIVFQLIFGEDMGQAWRTVREGGMLPTAGRRGQAAVEVFHQVPEALSQGRKEVHQEEIARRRIERSVRQFGNATPEKVFDLRHGPRNEARIRSRRTPENPPHMPLDSS